MVKDLTHPAFGLAFKFSFESEQLTPAASQLRKSGFLPLDQPTTVLVDSFSKASKLDWPTALDRASRQATAEWTGGAWLTAYVDGRASTVCTGQRETEFDALTMFLAEFPFDLVCFAPIYPAWWTSLNARKVWNYSLGNAHLGLGWAVAFRGKAHDTRLVSRRLLDFGPWRVHRIENDVTLVQLHDVETDSETALHQVEVSYPQLCGGTNDGGGHIPLNYQFPDHAPGDYMPAKRVLRIPILGTPPSHKDLLDAAAIRARNALGPDRPVDEVIYAFADPEEAEAHKHRVWLYGHTVVTFIDGKETDITADYDPEPDPPEWVKRLDGV